MEIKKFDLEQGPEFWDSCKCNSSSGWCPVRRTIYDSQIKHICSNLTKEQRKMVSYNSQKNVREYHDFKAKGFDDKWLEYYLTINHDVNDCVQSKFLQIKKDQTNIKYLENLDLSNNSFEKVEIACVGHYPKQFSSIGDSPVLKKINLNDLDIGEYQHNRWAESRAFVADGLFSDDAEYIGYVGASWNDKFVGEKIDNFENWKYSKYMINSKEIVLCAHMNCSCVWGHLIKGIIKEHDNIFEKLQDLFDLEIRHQKVPFCNQFISHRTVVEEYIDYIKSNNIMPKVDNFVQKEVASNFVGEFYKHRVEAYIMEMLGCFWWSKKNYIFISNGYRDHQWYRQVNNDKRLKAYEDSLVDKS